VKKIGTMILGVVAVALSTTACASVDRFTMLSPTVTVVAGVSMLDPGNAASVTYDAVQLEPQLAGLIAAFAVAAAPAQADRIVAAATSGAPDRAAEIEVAAKRALRRKPQTVAQVPDHAYLVRLLDRAAAASRQHLPLLIDDSVDDAPLRDSEAAIPFRPPLLL
jgi:hypothetical protein